MRLDRGLWRKTVVDLGSRKWKKRARAIDGAKVALENEVFEAVRHPLVSERDQQHYAHLTQRLAYCAAFGQYSDKFPSHQQERSQHGLFGTSAAFQVLSRSSWTVGQSPSIELSPWAERYARTLNFLDLILGETTRRDGTFMQREMTLRACMLIRAYAAAKKVPDDKIEALDPELKAELDKYQIAISTQCSKQTKVLLKLLQSCQVRADSLSEGNFKAGNNPNERAWKYSESDDNSPQTYDEWVFVWAQVLVAIGCACSVGLLDSNEVAAYCREDDFELFKATVMRPPADLDRRFQLMGLWSLSHFDFHTERGPLAEGTGTRALKETHLKVRDRERRRFKKAIRTLTNNLITSEVQLVDSWLPYSLRPSGTAWRDDFMVVPVVPILLQLVSRYRTFTLSTDPVMNLLEISISKDKQRDIGRARPYQIGNRDGIVNLSYYHLTYDALSNAMESIQRSVAYRVATTVRGMWHGYGRLAFLFTLLLISVVSVWRLQDHPKNAVLGIIFGVSASFLAAVASPPIIKFIWGDSHQ